MEATFAEIWRQVREETRRRIAEGAKRASATVKPILKRIGSRIFEGKLNVNALLKEETLTASTWDQFRAEVEATPWEYITRQRVRAAKSLIEDSDAKFWLIADLVGQEDPKNFGTWYKKHSGVSPTEARRHAARLREAGAREPRVPDEAWTAFCRELAAGVHWLKAELGHETVLRIFRTRLVVRTGQFFEALSERSRHEGRRDRQRGIQLAELALASVEGSYSTLGPLAAELRARGLARLANALRLANDHEGAERELRKAEQALEFVATARKTAVLAEILCYRASLRRFQNRYEEAREDLHRALARCKSTGQTRLEALAWMQLAAVHFDAGDCQAALMPLLSARPIADEVLREDPHLRLGFLSQLACVEAEAGQGADALLVLPEIRRLATELEHRTAELQADWIEAMARPAEPAAVERLLLRARQGFLDLRDVGHTAIVSVDLALHYEAKGRAVEVINLAAEALPALEALRLPEAAAALDLLHRAIATDRITRQLLMRIRKVLLAGG